MIRRYNLTQTTKAIALSLGGIFFCWLAFRFFRHVPAFVAHSLGFPIPAWAAVSLGLAGVGVAWISGYRTWKERGGLLSYHESALYHNLGEESAGTAVLDFYAHRITGPAYVLSQIFMAGPQWLLRAWTLFCSRIPFSSDLEMRLQSTLERLRAANKWQGIREHPDSKEEIYFLAQMGLIDFSAQKGTARFKAR